ncbi:hypothetical protein H112_02995 [Trichophyton rubrum D6]|uniref:Uncharacterized protein n=2 Tax=Trichophyton rubrum TaxID=5551 RepID=A0A080WHH8_TRIRC|nr:uncharacterized protein TERG_12315 [Trichophyton rubrum CBS 118892]EZF24504.1 hypothetical protein H100_02999 [Trichophyton rubrum MR850]EZF43552.1 hypothetical protein H102_02993 [Trichophyton rubrum CBS 100081]EZF54204.1 hypothetical protein H103_03007 [Trichophyton rubrum CBS 288.86]EZF64821.1 hypothetical protein H104_02987 [Trichophyton rubrum CBS 289.86]EZF86044.1 hypothetical protein H110_03001 [Trichophyton rubrum MR1448]EZF96907.1 hypothetical protein H113_03008 [Trichophyton rubr
MLHSLQHDINRPFSYSFTLFFTPRDNPWSYVVSGSVGEDQHHGRKYSITELSSPYSYCNALSSWKWRRESTSALSRTTKHTISSTGYIDNICRDTSPFHCTKSGSK